MEHPSLWQKTSVMPAAFPPLPSDLTCEAVVVGAGLTGILTAYFLQKHGVDVVLLDSGIPGQCVTSHTTAKITIQHGHCFANLIASHDFDTAKQYVHANLSAIDAYEDLISSLAIDCDFQKVDSFLYSRNSSAPIHAELDAAKALGLDALFSKETQLPFPIAGAMKLSGQAVFHPLKFLYALLPHLRIFGNTTVKKVTHGMAITDHAVVKAKHIIIATRFPFFLTPGFFFARMHQERSYAFSISDAPPLNGIYIDAAKNGVTFRPWQDQIVLGGCGHRTGYTSPQSGYKALQNKIKQWYPHSQITAQWSAEDCIPADGIPYIGSYAQESSWIHVATGFQEWGMTSAMLAAQILTDHVCGRKNEYSGVFSPHRFPNTSGAGKILKDGAVSTKNLLKQAFFIPRVHLEQIQPGQGGIIQWNGHKAGVYHREDGKYFLVSTRCPHMGCQLNWNAEERSWDCPCHGSRFSYDGTRLNPPASKNLSCRCHKAQKKRAD